MLAPLLVISMVAGAAAQDTAVVAASLSNDQVVVGERFELIVGIQTTGASPESIELLPLPAGFDIAGTSSQMETQIGLGGQRRVSTTHRWVLVGRVPGTFTMPRARVVVGGRTYRTAAIPVVVLRAPAGAPPPGSTDRVRLIAVAQPDTVYVGQQVTFSAEAWFPNELRQRQTRPATYQAPNPAGFWAQDLPDPLITGLRSVDGQVYNTQTFRRGYFPLVAGRHAFPPARLAYEFRTSLGLPPDTRELASDSVVVTVLPIPQAGRPAGYNGAVGRFSIRSAIESDQLTVGEATTLSLEVEGSGNVKALPAPDLPELDGVEVFPPTEGAEVDAASLEVGGTKRFEWVIVPTAPGRVSLPPIEYSYFDPVARRFEVARTDSTVIQVAAAVGRPGGDIDLRPIRGRPSGAGLTWTSSPGFAALQAVPLLILLLVARNARSKKREGARRLDQERQRAFQELHRDALAADRAFWGRLDEAIRASAAAILNSPETRSAPVDVLRRRMDGAGVPRPTAAAIVELLSSLDHMRFAPGAIVPADAPAYVERAEELLQAMSAAVAKLETSRRSTTAGMLLLALAAPTVAQAQSAPFERAVEAFRSANYEIAATAFLEHTAANPRDANGWYDAGNALYLTGRTGQAVAAWMRAVRLRPRHTDARANLSAASSSALDFVPPPFALTAAETMFGLAVAWWIALLAAAVRVRRKQRPGGAVGGAAVAALAILAAGFVGSANEPAAVSLGVETVVRVDPALKGEPLDLLSPGSPMSVVDRREGWVRIRTVTGVEGWVDATLIEEL